MMRSSYLAIALVVFVVAMTGSDIAARMTIGGDSFRQAVDGHLEWASVTVPGILFLSVPFVVIALVCAAANKQARTRSVVVIFGVGMLGLLYFYYNGFQSAEQSLLDKRWTAAALSVGLLPFFVGIPAILAAAGMGRLASRFDPKMPD